MHVRRTAFGLACAVGTMSAIAWGAEPSQAERAAVLAAAEEVFAAIAAHDGERFRRIMLPQGVLVSSTGKPDEPAHVRTVAEFAEYISNAKGAFEERMWDAEVHIDGHVASIWAPYEVLLDGKLRHCGYDSFQLVRVEREWRIVTVTYSMVPAEQCNPHA